MSSIWTALGQRPSAARQADFAASPNYADGAFQSPLPIAQPNPISILPRWFSDRSPNREPSAPIPTEARSAADYTEPFEGVRATWLGHSTVLLELDGHRFLIDPVFGHASPTPLFGVPRFFPSPLALDDLPPLDAVLLSHDHYDHLEASTMQALAHRVPRFITPLGMGDHLRYWGVPADRITERDWWQTTTVGGIALTATPARHFSGRNVVGRNSTQWAGWSLHGPQHRMYYSGDSGWMPQQFGEIGGRVGPFDLTLMQIGAYDELWADLHMFPEEAVRAHEAVRGDVLLPIHWGTFNLAFHGWTDPIDRLLAAAPSGMTVATPRPGQFVTLGQPVPTESWWRGMDS